MARFQARWGWKSLSVASRARRLESGRVGARLSFLLGLAFALVPLTPALAQDEQSPSAVYYYLLENTTTGTVERRFKDTARRYAFTGAPSTSYRVYVLLVPDLTIGESTFTTPDQAALSIVGRLTAFGRTPPGGGPDRRAQCTTDPGRRQRRFVESRRVH